MCHTADQWPWSIKQQRASEPNQLGLTPHHNGGQCQKLWSTTPTPQTPEMMLSLKPTREVAIQGEV